MESPSTALLIDFENLVIGVNQPAGEAGARPPVAVAPIDVGVLISLARDHGALAVARAYADWRLSSFNRYQTVLYREGLDVVHVRGRRRKNAVDLRLAVDAMQLLYERPDIETFVVATGDRDFLHLFAKLQAMGRRVVLVAPAASASNELAHTCDRFVTYETLWRTELGRPSAEMARQLELFKARLALVAVDPAHADGLVGSALKTALRKSIGPTFDEINLGFVRFKDLIAACPGVVKVVQQPGQSDFTVHSLVSSQEAATFARAIGVEARPLENEELDRFIGRARERLGHWRYEWDVERRRDILQVLFGTMQRADRFTQDSVIERLRAAPEAFGAGPSPSATQLSRYLSVCYQSTMFVVEQHDRDLPVRARRLKLRKEYESVEDFIARYEQSILYKVAELLRIDDDLDQAARRARAVLGVGDDADSYIHELLSQIQEVTGKGLAAVTDT